MERQIPEHFVLGLGTFQIIGTHGHDIGFNGRAFHQQLAAQLRSAKALQDIFSGISVGIQGFLYGSHSLFICVGIDNDLVRGIGATTEKRDT